MSSQAAGGCEARLAYVGRLSRPEPLAEPARSSEGDVMRTLRVALVGTAILALLVGSTGAVSAMMNEEEIPAAFVTGSRIVTRASRHLQHLRV